MLGNGPEKEEKSEKDRLSTDRKRERERERDVMAARRELQLWKQDICLMMFCINRACVFVLCKPRHAAVLSCTLISPTPMIR